MKQFLLYLAYVGILFVIQIAVLGLLSLTGVAPDLTEVLYLFSFLPGGLMAGLLFMLGLESLLLPTGWFFLAFLAGVVALTYALVVGAVLWGITYIIIRIRDNGLKT